MHYIRLDKINELSFRSALLQVSFELGLNDYRPISYLGFFSVMRRKIQIFIARALYHRYIQKIKMIINELK